ncbi:MAG: caspase family protein, partial [Kiritimatiellae bacterium]|nr:caspase family protein [Kiritimatiellia bacterium]
MKRHALFVGVNSYNDQSIRWLRYSIPDASVLADRFKGLGYKTRLLPDPTEAELKKAILESVDGLGRGDVFLFFFAGHGFTAQDGAHLLFCRDSIQVLLRVNGSGVKVDALEALTDKGGFHRAFLLDSCRTDCFAGVE